MIEVLIGVVLAIGGMIWAFFRGKDTQRREDFEGEVERGREANEDAQQGAQDRIDEIDERIEENENRDIPTDESIDILRDRHGWGEPS